MANLLIKLVAPGEYGQWRILVTNSQIEYSFAGANAEAQLENVKILRQAMQQGEEAVLEQIENVLTGIENEGSEVVRQLYGTSTSLYYDGQFVIDATLDGYTSLLEDIVEAGELLASFV